MEFKIIIVLIEQHFTAFRLFYLTNSFKTALWASLPADAQARIGMLAIREEFASQVALDGGFETIPSHRIIADQIRQATADALPEAVWSVFPDLLPIDHDDLYPLWQVLGDEWTDQTPDKVTVRGMADPRPLVFRDRQWFVPNGSDLIELCGARDLASRQDGANPRWEFWTTAQIDAERRRRHPEFDDAVMHGRAA